MIPWQSNPLTPDETQRKITAIQCHATQYAVSEKFLKSFLRNNELFADYPPSRLKPRGVRQGRDGGRGRRSHVGRRKSSPGRRRRNSSGWSRAVCSGSGIGVIVSIDFTGLLSGGVEAAVSVFGYRTDRPFAEMPKTAHQVQR